MTTVIVGMLIALALSLAVVALVAVPARRAGRDVLTPQGEQIMQSARDRTAEMAGAARDKMRPGADDDSDEDADVEAKPAQVDLREQPVRARD